MESKKPFGVVRAPKGFSFLRQPSALPPSLAPIAEKSPLSTFWEDFDLDWTKNAGRIDELVAPGCAKVKITPKLGKLTFADGSINSTIKLPVGVEQVK